MKGDYLKANSAICATTSAFVNPFKSIEPDRQEAVQAPHPLQRALLICATCFSPMIVLFVNISMALYGHTLSQRPHPMHFFSSTSEMVPIVSSCFFER